MPRIFPAARLDNFSICVPTSGGTVAFSVYITDAIPGLKFIGDGGTQCFPLYLYDEPESADADAPQSSLFDQHAAKPVTRNRRDAITDAGLAHFASAYLGEKISKEDLFYYIYGLLHSPDYRARYADNLAKELPRIPRVKTAADFWAFSKAGRALANLHLNYESVAMYAKAEVISDGGKPLDLGNPKALDSRFRGNDERGRGGNDERGRGGNDEREKFWRVEKMKVPKSGKDKDLTRLVYNAHITVTGIPAEAYDYVVNGKPALDWVIERQCVKTDKDSGIVNDANAWATETMHNPRYPLELFLRVITVSLETMQIVRALPELDILEAVASGAPKGSKA